VHSIVKNLVFDASVPTVLQEIAAESFFNSVSYTVENFKVEHERDFIMTKISEMVVQQNEDIRLTGF
jgi:hypothetical protein